jgi:hypothetical protein
MDGIQVDSRVHCRLLAMASSQNYSNIWEIEKKIFAASNLVNDKVNGHPYTSDLL